MPATAPPPATDALIDAAFAEAARRPRPASTYRLQFHKGFTFAHATAILPYLRDLGVSHVYASPYLKAVAGSTHGYDVIDHCTLNLEVGTAEDYDRFLAALKESGLGHVLDVVPNHVGVSTNENLWWNDVLERGPASRYAAYFDIAWRGSPRPQMRDKLLLALLGDPYAEVLERGELKLKYDDGKFAVHYFDRVFPIAPETYPLILGDAVAARLPAARDAKVALGALAADPDVRRQIDRRLGALNGAPGDPRSFDALDALLVRQHYRLAYWKTAPDEINYRRFFDVNALAALSMERPEVFEATHAFVLGLWADGKIDGFRIDHPDGLFDPKQYLERLQDYAIAFLCERNAARAGTAAADRGAFLARLAERRAAGSLPATPPPMYVTVEKILAVDEPLPTEWPVDGTSGYDFLIRLNNLYVDLAAEAAFTKIYADWSDQPADFHALAYRKKRLILSTSLASELHMLTARLDDLAQRHRASRDFTFSALRDALAAVIANFPVYRSYVADGAVRPADADYVEAAVNAAARREPKVDRRLLNYIRDTLLLRAPDTFGPQDVADQLRFVGKFQQVTSPATAKGIEDTAFYVYNRLVSLNEVGGEPGQFGAPPEALHRYLADRQAHWPHALSALSTHDTKRSEDVRARLNVLSEIPEEWRARSARWRELNAPHRRDVAGAPAPRPNDEYLVYQTLLGAWPTEGLTDDGRAAFAERIKQYLQKALREAKTNTSWTDPDEAYESAVAGFVDRLLDPKHGRAFVEDFTPFQQKVGRHGAVNALSQTLVRLLAPGVPDTYQGTELTDLSLVDPDNRRPVDYELRKGLLAGTGAGGAELITSAAVADGRAKLWLTSRLLRLRRDERALFADGEYVPLAPSGSRGDCAFAFARRLGGRSVIAIAPRFTTRLTLSGEGLPVGTAAWHETALRLPPGSPSRWRNVVTNETVEARLDVDGASVRLSDALANFPVAALVPDAGV